MAVRRLQRSNRRKGRRRLLVESLELRRVLATFMVNTAIDVVDGQDGLTSLREAIGLANGAAGPDTITFDPAPFATATTIDLSLGELGITDSVAILGPAANLTLDAEGRSRLFHVSPLAADVTLDHLIISGGLTTSDNDGGGAIRFASGGTLRLDQVTLVNNATTGTDSPGGAIFSLGIVELNNSLVTGNRTSGARGHGGGIYLRDGSFAVTDSEISSNRTTGRRALGGGFYANAGTVTVTDSVIRNNQTIGDESDGGGIFALADVTVITSEVSGNSTFGEDADGGGISVRGSLAIAESIVNANSTSGRYAAGGGIAASDGALTLTASSITGNLTTGDVAYGGGILSVRGNVNVTNSTLSGNSALGNASDGGGLAGVFSSVTLSGSTITLNTSGGTGGGVSFFDNVDKSLTFRNSIVAGNTDSGSAPDFRAPQIANALTVSATLIGDNTGTSLAEAQSGDGMGNLVGAPSPGLGIIDPMLAPLVFSGKSFIHPLLVGSRAINAGDNAMVTTMFDGRGEPFLRIANGLVDMGAFESQTINDSRLVVTTELDELDFSNGDVSLREALLVANGNPGLDIISFDATAFSQSRSIDLLLGEFEVTETVSIAGPAASSLTINAQGNSRVFNILESAGDVTLSGLTITGGVTTANNFDGAQRSGDGGGVRFASSGSLSIVDAIVTGNRTLGAGASGGGISANSGAVILTGSTVSGNQTIGTNSHGGGIATVSGAISVTASAITDNTTDGEFAFGGGIHSVQGNVNVNRSTVSANRSAGGGGITASSGNLLVTDSVISNNSTVGVQGQGGGIHSASGRVTIDRSRIIANHTLGNQAAGGGIFSGSAAGLFVSQSEVRENTTAGLAANGGGIDALSATLVDSTVSFNATNGASSHGGGIHARSLLLTNSTVSENRVQDNQGIGGGIVALVSTIQSSTIVMNTSAGRSGGIELSDASTAQLTIINSIVASNSDNGAAPDLFHPQGHAGALAVSFSLIGNSAGTDLVPSAMPDASGNLIGSDTPAGTIDPLLGPLLPYGGRTSTHALQANSPAINRGNATLASQLVNDQRGAPFVRVAGGLIDMGAYERQTLSPDLFVVTTSLDEVDASDSDVSLREAVQHANGSVGADSITLDPSLFPGPATIELTLGELEIVESVTITGPGKDLLRVDPQGRSRVIHFSAEQGDLMVSGLTIAGGAAAGNGGGINFASTTGTLTLSDVMVIENTSDASGGGVFSANSLVIQDSQVTSNNALGAPLARGGGIAAVEATVTRTTIENNRTDGGGGGISAVTANLVDSVVRDNISVVDGGGVLSTGFLELSRTVVTGNSTQGKGGGINATSLNALALRLSMSAVTLNNTTSLNGDGGGIFVSGDALISDSTISGNVTTAADANGGGVFVSDGALEITRSTVANNTAGRTGGGVLTGAATSATLTINSSIFAGNSDLGIAPNFRVTQNPTGVDVQFSLIDDNTGTALIESQTPDVRGNLIGRPAPAGGGIIDAMLGPRTTIAGTQIHPLLTGSPAIGSGNNSLALPDNDQRGAPFVRVFDGSIDMGSFELQPPVEPIIQWPDPASIVVGTPLGSRQLNATTNTPGSFVYSPANGTVLNAGPGQTLTVDFTPDDTTHFLPATAMATIDVLEPMDFGDAPDSYATLLSSDGPRHAVSPLRLGEMIDYETDGRPTARGSGDGLDEDGVVAISSLVADDGNPTTASFLVNSSASAMLDAWIDFNGNGLFDHPAEHFGGGASIDLSRGNNVVQVVVPAGSMSGVTFARFRLSSSGGLLPTGSANDGEVEDYQFTILEGSDRTVVDVALPRGPATLSSSLGELLITQRNETLFSAFTTAVGRYNIVATPFSDVLVIDDSSGDPLPSDGMTFDGGERVNTLRLIGPDSTFDTSSDSNVSIRNIDVIDVTTAGAKRVIVDAASVRTMDPTGGGVIVTGGPGDQVVFADARSWRMAAPVSVAGFSFSNVVTSGTFVQVDFASPWQNLAQPSDVNNDGNVSAVDALRVINEIGRRLFSDPVTFQLDDPADVSPWPNVYFDQNGDGNATALDALRVINELARLNGGAGGEGESVSSSQEARIAFSAAKPESPPMPRVEKTKVLTQQEKVRSFAEEPSRQLFAVERSPKVFQTNELLVDASFADREFVDEFSAGKFKKLSLPMDGD